MNRAAERIFLFRASMDLTQDEFAKSVGYSRSYLKDIERGRVKPSKKFIEAVSLKYGFSLYYLLSEYNEEIDFAIRSYSEFIFIFDFTEQALESAESELIQSLGIRKYLIINAEEFNESEKLYSYVDNNLSKDIEFLILKNISTSKLNKDKVKFFRGLFDPNILFGTQLIVIDKPSLLELIYNSISKAIHPIWFKEGGKSFFSRIRESPTR